MRLIVVYNPATGGCNLFGSDETGARAAERELRRVRGGAVLSIDAEMEHPRDALDEAPADDAPQHGGREAVRRSLDERARADRDELRRHDSRPIVRRTPDAGPTGNA